MARVIVTTGDGKIELMNEAVTDAHLADEHSSLQIIERMAWAVSDAERLDAVTSADAK